MSLSLLEVTLWRHQSARIWGDFTGVLDHRDSEGCCFLPPPLLGHALPVTNVLLLGVLPPKFTDLNPVQVGDRGCAC